MMNSATKSKYEDKSIDQGSQSIMNAYDLASVEELDPSLADGFKVVYDREIPLELRLQDVETTANEVGTLESIRTRVLLQVIQSQKGIENNQGEPQRPNVVKIEFTSEADLFFHYTSVQDEQRLLNPSIDEALFSRLKEEQKLNVEFSGFLNLLIKMCNSCQKEPQNFFAVFFMQKDGNAKLDFIQNMEYKFLELLSIEFAAANEDQIRQNISFRYSLLKAKSSVLQGKLKDIIALLKLKNPSLLLQLQKGSTQASRMSVYGKDQSSIHHQ